MKLHVKFLVDHDPQVYVVGGTGAVSQTVFDQIGILVGYGRTKRLGGSSRYDTARLIAEEFFPNPDAVSIVYGWNFPDALTGGVNAARYNAPILLVNINTIPSATTQYLTDKSYSITRIITYGGSNVVSEEVMASAIELIQ